MRYFHHPLSCAALISFLSITAVFGWGEKPHVAITKAALEVLPAWQQELLGEEFAKIGDSHCMIPDRVYTDKKNAKFAKMESKPDVVYLLNLHLPAQQPENLETLRYFMEKAVKAMCDGNISDAARYMGTLCHPLEDYGSPSHTVPGDNMFTLLQQFLPPTEAMKGELMHGPIENGDFNVRIKGYQPTLLGTTVNEASWRLMHRVHEGILNARTTTIPIIQALYSEDQAVVEKHQLKAATLNAKIVADALYTILCLGTKKFEPKELAALKQVQIGAFFPLEAESLYYPQSQFFGKPYWGHPHSGFLLANGNRPMPLKLRIEGPKGTTNKEFTKGISAGMGRSLTFLLPENVYTKFTVFAGLHPELGAKGRVEFTIIGDDKPLESVIISGKEPAAFIDCDVTGVSQLQLKLTPRGLAPKSNYAIWAEPILKREYSPKPP